MNVVRGGRVGASSSCGDRGRDIASVDFSPVEKVLRDAVADGAFPGCAAAIGAAAGRPWHTAAGVLGEGFPATVNRDTLYDLASLTKVLATASVSMRLVHRGLLALTDPVNRYLPRFRGANRDSVTIEHLLTHTSGLPAWKRLYGETAAVRTDVRDRDKMIATIIETPLSFSPGTRTVYSDLGAILLGECLAAVAACPLATLAWREVFAPLKMRDTLYRPPPSELWRIAPTEIDESYRGRLVHGAVHDENAHALGGVSGNAGLFSTAADMARFAREVLAALGDESPVFPGDIMREFTTRRNLVPDSTRGLGWDTRSTVGSTSGHLFSNRAFGHTGFTGTSLWIDPERALFAVLLSNRVHPTRDNRKIAPVRVAFHDAIIQCL